jgi:hypothetical protein
MLRNSHLFSVFLWEGYISISKVRGNGHWAMGNGHWALGQGDKGTRGQWALGNGQWALGIGTRGQGDKGAMGIGQWAMGIGHWDKGTRGQGGNISFFLHCPMPYAQCPMPLSYCHIFRQINILNRVKQLHTFFKGTLECLASRN